MYTDLDNSPPQYQAICRLLSDLDLSNPEASLVINAETTALLDTFSNPDWELFTRMAKAEGVAPLMFYAFSRSNYQLPSATRLQLQMAFYETAAFNQMLLTEMERVVQALNEANIPVIVLKGAVLATTIYPDPALRPMSDLDLLTAAPFLGKGLKLLRSQNYELLKITNHAVLESDNESKSRIELHWTLVGDHAMPDKDVANLIANMTMEPISSNLQLSFTLLYLCAHLMLQHSERRIIWLYDIFSFLRKYTNELEYNSLLDLAQRLGWVSALSDSIEAIIELFGFQPPEVLKIQLNKYIANSPDGKFESVQISMTRAFLALGFYDRLLMAWYFLFPSPGYLRGRYHSIYDQPLPFLYLYRLRDLITGDVKSD